MLFWWMIIVSSSTYGLTLPIDRFRCISEVRKKHFDNEVVFIVNQAKLANNSAGRSLLPSTQHGTDGIDILLVISGKMVIYNELPSVRVRRYFGKKDNLILLLDSDTNVTKTAESIKYYNMFTPKSKVLVVFHHSVTQQHVTHVLRVMWQVLKVLHTVVVTITNQSAEFHTLFPYHTSKSDPVIVDSCELGVFRYDCAVFPNKFPPSIKGNILTMVVYPIPPYVINWVSEKIEERGLEPLMVQTIADLLGFELKTLPPPLLFFGGSPKTALDGDREVGIPGMLYHHEADINVGSNKPDVFQIEINDILYPHFVDDLVWLIPRMGVAFHWWNLLVFEVIVWIFLAISVLLTASSLSWIFKLPSSFFNAFGALLEQSCSNRPRLTSARIIMGAYLFCGIIITTAYRSFLFSVLTSKTEVNFFDSPEEAVKAGWTSYLAPSGREFYNTTNHDFWNILMAPKRHEWSMNLTYTIESITSKKEGLSLIIDHCAQFILNKGFVDQDGKEEAVVIGHYLPYLVVAFVAPGHPLTHIFNRKIHQLMDGGFIEHWMDRQIFSVKTKNLFRHSDQDVGIGVAPLTSTQLIAPFGVFFVILFLSSIVFLIELSSVKIKSLFVSLYKF